MNSACDLYRADEGPPHNGGGGPYPELPAGAKLPHWVAVPLRIRLHRAGLDQFTRDTLGRMHPEWRSIEQGDKLRCVAVVPLMKFKAANGIEYVDVSCVYMGVLTNG